jgi:hypothetical protein
VDIRRKDLILGAALLVVVALVFVSLQAGRIGELRRNLALRDGKRQVAEELTRVIYQFYGVQAAHEQALYVGSEVCLLCHAGPNPVFGRDTSGWRESFHAHPFKTVEDDQYSMVVGKGIVADSDQNGVDDFKDGLNMNNATVFQKYAPNAPILGYSDQTGYTMTIGEVTYKIFMAWGGNGVWKHRFIVKIPVNDRATGLSAGAYITPLQYNERTHEWVEYHPEHWWDEAGEPVITPGVNSRFVASVGRSFDKRCAGCHFTGTGIRQDSKGEWVGNAAPVVLLDPEDRNYIDFDGDGLPEMTHVGCEACHGPGSLHVLVSGDPDFIINPITDFDARQANDSCGQCHVRGSSSNGTFGFLWDEENDHSYIQGDTLDPYFTPKPGLWPDGKTSKQHHQQWHELNESTKFETRCFECHDVHIADRGSLRKFIKQEENGEDLWIPVSDQDNTLCLACHAGEEDDFAGITKSMILDYEENRAEIGEVVEAHSHHPYGPERQMGLSRCSGCHMPTTAKTAINYDVRSHTFEAISPEKTLIYKPEGGMPNSCSVNCHRNIVDIFPNGVDSDIGNWTEDSDIDLAEWLLQYYGPDGIWWKRSAENGGGE